MTTGRFYLVLLLAALALLASSVASAGEARVYGAIMNSSKGGSFYHVRVVGDTVVLVGRVGSPGFTAAVGTLDSLLEGKMAAYRGVVRFPSASGKYTLARDAVPLGDGRLLVAGSLDGVPALVAVPLGGGDYRAVAFTKLPPPSGSKVWTAEVLSGTLLGLEPLGDGRFLVLGTARVKDWNWRLGVFFLAVVNRSLGVEEAAVASPVGRSDPSFRLNGLLARELLDAEATFCGGSAYAAVALLNGVAVVRFPLGVLNGSGEPRIVYVEVEGLQASHSLTGIACSSKGVYVTLMYAKKPSNVVGALLVLDPGLEHARAFVLSVEPTPVGLNGTELRAVAYSGGRLYLAGTLVSGALRGGYPPGLGNYQRDYVAVLDAETMNLLEAYKLEGLGMAQSVAAVAPVPEGILAAGRAIGWPSRLGKLYHLTGGGYALTIPRSLSGPLYLAPRGSGDAAMPARLAPFTPEEAKVLRDAFHEARARLEEVKLWKKPVTGPAAVKEAGVRPVRPPPLLALVEAQAPQEATATKPAGAAATTTAATAGRGSSATRGTGATATSSPGAVGGGGEAAPAGATTTGAASAAPGSAAATRTAAAKTTGAAGAPGASATSTMGSTASPVTTAAAPAGQGGAATGAPRGTVKVPSPAGAGGGAPTAAVAAAGAVVLLAAVALLAARRR